MEFIIAVVVITVLYFVIKKVRGPLPPKQEPKFGGAPYDEETKTNPNEE